MPPTRPLKHLMDLSGRVALVTGGAGHVGREAAAAVAELGAKVALADISGDACTAAALTLSGQYDAEVLAVRCDLAAEAEVKAMPDRVARVLGGVDIIVHAAAFVGDSELTGWAVPFPEQSPETWRAALEVNLTSAFVLVQAATPWLEKSRAASVIQIASIYGMLGPDLRLYDGTGMGNPAAYAASKGGLLQMTRWLSTVLAPKVRVNAITPGGLWRRQAAEFVERYESRVPLGRMGSEEDLKGAVAFLASDLSAYVTGHNLVVDGGWTAW